MICSRSERFSAQPAFGLLAASLFLIGTTLAPAAQAQTACVTDADPALMITAVFDGPLTGGTPKGVELLATQDIADLSLFGIGSANNGGGTDGEELTLSGSAKAGDFIYVASDSTQFNAFFGFKPDFVGDAASINGDDAIELFCNGVVVDVFGDIDTDGTGQAWEHLDGWAYRNNATGPDGTTFDVTAWTFSGVDALDGEKTNATATTPVPLGTYTP